VIYEDLERLKKEALEQLEDLQVGAYSIEVAHFKADEVLYTLLLELGYTEIVEVYTKIDKWYD